ncbi:hypothetical protein [Flavobacterium capsici]|uniref:Uncharacterized protein n=1 Tax=Flavobacterium capsici TaxID=3075618 RepID=A0AA96EXZ9_9FLAO|nr:MULTISPECIES: hypothetical protein [unclassified Flavobacterium]WNM19283.1 hypothetical protein RN608_01040 [Flavobacterium sp. PMR2A8]WNM20672.1 hypothetical protein RN605_08210 [Flavobacterium sp. PMTSA4]
MKTIKKIYAYFIAQRWHLHSIALPIGFVWSFLMNYCNFMHLKEAYFEGKIGTEHYFQTILTVIIGYGFSWLFEVWQAHQFQVNLTWKEWQKNSVPDILFTGSVFIIGHLIYIAIF